MFEKLRSLFKTTDLPNVSISEVQRIVDML